MLRNSGMWPPRVSVSGMSLFPTDMTHITDSESESIASKESAETSQINELNFLRHQNRRLREEVNIFKQKSLNLERENHELKMSKCEMQAKVEVEEEFITNSLLRQIASLKKNMENIRVKFDREEECVLVDLSSKLQKLENEKTRLEKLLETSRQDIFEKLNRRIQKLENDTISKQRHLDQLRIDKGNIQNSLEQEQEMLLNRLWRNISQAERERRIISDKIDVHSPEHRPSSHSESLHKNIGGKSHQSFSLQPHELSAMPMEDLAQYVISLQHELSKIQTRFYELDPENYQKLLKDCEIKDNYHWIKQKIAPNTEDFKIESNLISSTTSLPTDVSK